MWDERGSNYAVIGIIYLGHVTKIDRRYTLVIVRDFNCKFNRLMADFGCQVMFSKISYFNNIGWYVMAIRIVSCIIKIIRQALRVLSTLPYQTHNALLPHITGIPPVNVCLAERF